ncbi:MAG: aminotransferase class V-fold PLP-dependent enzyme [Gemmatimonadales bacterium]|nr:MAG: aminotransferase class V-fold PLP-dependent enzyme [Gemmatimonadales bacterium]
MTAAEVHRLREDTPGVVHGIHLNNAGAALTPRPVQTAIAEHLQAEVELGGYEAADARADRIDEAYRSVEALLGAPRGSVAFVENATVGFAQALSAIPFRAGDRILTTRNDYVSNHLMYLSLEERLNIETLIAPDAPEGGVDTGALVDLARRKRPRLVAMTHIPTSSGLVQDPAPVGAFCREFGIPFLVDACQSVGQMPLDVEALGATFLSATSRKFLRGPRGSGFLYIAPEALERGLTPLFPDLRGADWVTKDLAQPAPDARRFENWEFSWALVLGTGAAARYALDTGIEAIRDRSRALADRLRTGLDSIEGSRVLDRGPELCAIVTVHLEGATETWVRKLRERGIRTSWVDRSSAVLDYDDQGVDGALRISPHAYNTEEEVDEALDALRTLRPDARR